METSNHILACEVLMVTIKNVVVFDGLSSGRYLPRVLWKYCLHRQGIWFM